MDAPDAPRRSLRPGRRLLFVLLLLTVGVLLGGARYGYWTLVERRWLTISEGRVYKSGALSTERLLSQVAEHGIRTVIDLRQEAQGDLAGERAALEGAGVRYVNLPTGQVPKGHSVEDFYELIDDPSIYPVLVHCEHGAGRSVLFCALYRIEIEGWSPEQALEATTPVRSFGGFADDDKKGRFLRAYVPRRERGEQAQAAGEANAPGNGG